MKSGAKNVMTNPSYETNRKPFDKWWAHMYEALNPSDLRRSSLYREMCWTAWKAAKANK